MAVGPLGDDLELLRQHAQPERAHDGAGNVVLQFEDVLELSVIAFRPHVAVGAPVDQLRGDPHAVIDLPHAAFEDVLDAEPVRHLVDVDVLPLEGESRIARHDEKR